MAGRRADSGPDGRPHRCRTTGGSRLRGHRRPSRRPYRRRRPRGPDRPIGVDRRAHRAGSAFDPMAPRPGETPAKGPVRAGDHLRVGLPGPGGGISASPHSGRGAQQPADAADQLRRTRIRAGGSGAAHGADPDSHPDRPRGDREDPPRSPDRGRGRRSLSRRGVLGRPGVDQRSRGRALPDPDLDRPSGIGTGRSAFGEPRRASEGAGFAGDHRQLRTRPGGGSSRGRSGAGIGRIAVHRHFQGATPDQRRAGDAGATATGCHVERLRRPRCP